MLHGVMGQRGGEARANTAPAGEVDGGGGVEPSPGHRGRQRDGGDPWCGGGLLHGRGGEVESDARANTDPAVETDGGDGVEPSTGLAEGGRRRGGEKGGGRGLIGGGGRRRRMGGRLLWDGPE